jgi:hypothetical protein
MKIIQRLKDLFNRDAHNRIDASLRFSHKGDVSKILNFYRGNRHQHVHIRDENLLAELVTRGNFLILEDKKTGEILASSGTYPYKVKGDKDLPSYMEIGSTRFSEKVAGFGLYPLFISSQVIHASLTKSCTKMFIANVYDDSPVGRNLLTKKAGWKVVLPTKGILDVFHSTKDKTANDNKADNRTMTWYGSPPSCMPHQAKVVMDFLQNKRRIAHKNNGTVLRIDYSQFDLARGYSSHLLHLANLRGYRNLQDGEDKSKTLDIPKMVDFVDNIVSHQDNLPYPFYNIRPPY